MRVFESNMINKSGLLKIYKKLIKRAFLLKNLVVQLGLFCYSMAVLVPWGYRSWGGLCNNTWALELHNAFTNHLQFGKDIIFTFGPLGFLYYGITPETLEYVILYWSTLTVVTFLGIRKIASTGKYRFLNTLVLFIAVAAVASPDTVDAQAYFIILLYIFLNMRNVRDEITNNILVISIATLSMIKFSWFLASFVTVIPLELYSLLYKKIRWGIPIYIASITIIWFVCGQKISNFLEYIRNSWEIASFYSAAQSASGVTTPLSLSLFVISISIFIYIFYIIRTKLTLYIVVQTLFWFIIFKSGYVRNDYHETVSAAVLLSGYTLILPLILNKKKGMTLYIFGAASSILLFISLFYIYNSNNSFDSRLKNTLKGQGFIDVYRIISNPYLLWEKYHSEEDVFQKQNKQLIDYLGTSKIDIYPFGNVSSLILSGVNYCPRPVFESYSAYSQRLALLNAKVLLNPNYSTFILLGSATSDFRVPFLDDSLYLLNVIKFYEFVGSFGDFILLKRSDKTQNQRLSFVSQGPVACGTAISVPIKNDLKHSKIIWCQLTIPTSFLGSLMKLVYKIMPVEIQMINADASQTAAYNIIPEEAKVGFILSPLIQNSKALQELMTGGTKNLDQLYVSEIFINGSKLFYDWSHAYIQFYEINND
jgi:hypothetical protein